MKIHLIKNSKQKLFSFIPFGSSNNVYFSIAPVREIIIISLVQNKKK